MSEPSVAVMRAPPTRNSRIETLDHIRAFSALLVVLGHALHYLNELPPQRGGGITIPYFQNGFGSMIFIAMSGFMGYITTVNRYGISDAASFLRRRMQRLIPLYWLFTSIWLAIALIVPSLLTKGGVDPWHVVSSYLFIPAKRPFDGMAAPVLSLGWTLNYIIIFYIVFAAAITIPIRFRLPVISLLVLSAIVAHEYIKNSVPFSFWTDRYIVLALVGIYLGAAWKRSLLRPVLPYGLGAVIVIAACFMAWAIMYHGRGSGFSVAFVIASILSFLIVAVCIVTKAAGGKAFNKTWASIAASSYSLYLSHPFTLGIVIEAWKYLGLYHYANGWALLFLELVSSVVVGLLVYKYVEKTITRYIGN